MIERQNRFLVNHERTKIEKLDEFQFVVNEATAENGIIEEKPVIKTFKNVEYNANDFNLLNILASGSDGILYPLNAETSKLAQIDDIDLSINEIIKPKE